MSDAGRRAPFISLAPSFAPVETLVAGVAERSGPSARQRMAAFEKLGSGAGRVSG